MSRLWYTLAIVALILTACGSSATDELSLVAVAAHWECDRQRFAFDSLADIGVARNEMLEAAGISDAAFTTFESDLASDVDLRLEVFAEYEDYCGVTDEGTDILEN